MTKQNPFLEFVEKAMAEKRKKKENTLTTVTPLDEPKSSPNKKTWRVPRK